MSSPADPTRLKTVFLAALVISALFYLLFILRTGFPAAGETWFSLFDDAMISMRYAKNLAEGHGLVWNPGQPPVEGYTNLGWTLWMSALHLLPVPQAKVCLLVMISGALLLLLNLAVVGALAKLVSDRDPAVVGSTMLLVGLSYPLAYWTLRGLEVGLLTLLIDLGLLFALQLRRGYRPLLLAGLAAILGLGILVRTDALVPGLVISLYTWAVLPGPRRWRSILVLASTLALALAAKSLVSLALYGQAMPNTYYLKLGGVSLAERVNRGLATLWLQVRTNLALLLAPPALLLIPYLRSRGRTGSPLSPLLLLLGLFAGQAAYSVYVGGDAWEWWMLYPNRYLCPALPALILAACLVVCPAARKIAAGRAGAWDRLGRLLLWTGLGAAVLGLIALSLRSESPFPPYGLYSRSRFILGTGALSAGLLAVVLARLPGLLRGGEKRPEKGESGQRRTVQAWAMLALAWLAINLVGLLPWLLLNAHHVHDDALMTRLGLFVRQGTAPQARVAVAWAGAVPYFSGRPAVDLLGKNDPVIARMAPVVPFQPGHNKWDLSYSVGRLRPDLVITFGWGFSGKEMDYLQAQGYQQISPGFHVLLTSRLVNREIISRDWRDPKVLEAAIRGG